MGDSHWKLFVDQLGMTIANDRFMLTTAGAPISDGTDSTFELDQSTEIESIVAELESMIRRAYGQYCGLARAMELVGERWSLLIVRDLSVGPKTLAGLQHGLPRIPADTLTARLRELEHAGIVRRRAVSEDAVGYELTGYGTELEEIMLRFSRWGAKSLGDPRPGEIVTTDSLVVAIRAAFDPAAARGVHACYEIRHGNEIVIHVRVADGTAEVGPGPLPDADLVLEAGTALTELMTGELSAADALAAGSVTITGDPALLARFTELFTISRNR
jgi:DNA-binding HxlR family transcriptional regulator/putative sterol carrier protein